MMKRKIEPVLVAGERPIGVRPAMVVLKQETAEFCKVLLRERLSTLKSAAAKAGIEKHIRALEQALGNYSEE
jgi:hypothetical protein